MSGQILHGKSFMARKCSFQNVKSNREPIAIWCKKDTKTTPNIAPDPAEQREGRRAGAGGAGLIFCRCWGPHFLRFFLFLRFSYLWFCVKEPTVSLAGRSSGTYLCAPFDFVICKKLGVLLNWSRVLLERCEKKYLFMRYQRLLKKTSCATKSRIAQTPLTLLYQTNFQNSPHYIKLTYYSNRRHNGELSVAEGGFFLFFAEFTMASCLRLRQVFFVISRKFSSQPWRNRKRRKIVPRRRKNHNNPARKPRQTPPAPREIPPAMAMKLHPHCPPR
jgi:hypothetical protein